MKKEPLNYYDVFGKYMSFEIKQVTNNTVKIESQIVPSGTKKGYKVELIFDFEKITDYEYSEERDKDPKLMLIFSPAEMNIKEVKREENE